MLINLTIAIFTIHCPFRRESKILNIPAKEGKIVFDFNLILSWRNICFFLLILSSLTQLRYIKITTMPILGHVTIFFYLMSAENNNLG